MTMEMISHQNSQVSIRSGSSASMKGKKLLGRRSTRGQKQI
jgi:hypothetical protein